MQPHREQIIDGAALLHFALHRDNRGALVAFDHQQGLPFELKRVFYVFDVAAGSERARHAVSCESVVLALGGAFDLHCANGRDEACVRLADPAIGLHAAAGIHLRATNFAAGSVMLVLASQCFADVRYAAEPFFFD